MPKPKSPTEQPRELLRYNLRERCAEYFRDWEGQEVPAQHRFVPAENGHVRMSFTHPQPHRTQAEVVLDSLDKGEQWLNHSWIGGKPYPPSNLGLFQAGKNGDLRFAIFGNEFWRSYDGGYRWYGPSRIPSADDLHFDGLGAPNCFSAIMLTQGIYAGRIMLVADYFLEQEGLDGQLLCSVYTDDWGNSWHASRLFGPPDPLPKGPEGFGEPAVVQLPSGWLWMVFRTVYGELWQAISRDGGASWGRPTPTGLSSPIANCYAAREPTTGATVLCWNHTRPGTSKDWCRRESLWRPRTNLCFAVSRDNTRTWSVPVTVEAHGGFYPTLHFAEGRMFVMYQSAPDDEPHPWHEYGLTLVAYDQKEVAGLPAWTFETLWPYIDKGLVAPWRALLCQPPSRQTIS